MFYDSQVLCNTDVGYCKAPGVPLAECMKEGCTGGCHHICNIESQVWAGKEEAGYDVKFTRYCPPCFKVRASQRRPHLLFGTPFHLGSNWVHLIGLPVVCRFLTHGWDPEFIRSWHPRTGSAVFPSLNLARSVV